MPVVSNVVMKKSVSQPVLPQRMVFVRIVFAGRIGPDVFGDAEDVVGDDSTLRNDNEGRGLIDGPRLSFVRVLFALSGQFFDFYVFEPNLVTVILQQNMPLFGIAELGPFGKFAVCDQRIPQIVVAFVF